MTVAQKVKAIYLRWVSIYSHNSPFKVRIMKAKKREMKKYIKKLISNKNQCFFLFIMS